MDKREKLAALALKRRQEAQSDNKDSPKASNGKSKRPLSPRAEGNVSKRSSFSNVQNSRLPAPKKPSAIPRPIARPVKKGSRKETPSPPRIGGDDDYDEGDGFIVGSDDDSLEESESDALSSEDEKPKKSKSSKKARSKKSKGSSDEGSGSEASIALEDEIEDLDASNIIDHGPGLRTRSSRY